jgi:transitional endoplasmic reticulum ATPase
MVNVPVGHGETIQVPAGWFKAPGITGMIGIEPDFRNCRCIIQSSDMRRKHSGVIAELAKETEELLKTDSIYRGKPIHMTLVNGGLDLNSPPKFLSTDGVTLDQLIFSKDLQSEIDDYLYTLIDDTENCVRDNIPLKRGYLLEGPYGVGKSLLGRYLSKKCEENGWTYILIDDATALKDALILAKRYEPAVVFCEDIDRFAAERTDSANELLNTIDGVVGKDSKVICCLTTNHIERIQKDNQAILRPGRFDVVFSVTPPDDEAVERLIRYYAGALLDTTADISPACKILSGQIPAVIREAVERSKLSRIRRQDSMLSAEDLVTAARSMSKHMALLEVRADEPTDAEILHDKLGKASADAMNGGLSDMSVEMLRVKKDVRRLVEQLT